MNRSTTGTWARIATFSAYLAGVASLAVGIGLVPHLVKVGWSATSAVSVVLFVAGVVLVVWAVRRLVAGRDWSRRLLWAFGALAGVVLAAMVVGPAVAVTHVPPTDIGQTPADVGLVAEDVRLDTEDGVRLAAWYVPGSNGAAVVVLHGAGSTRSDVLPEAEVLAEAGFGVLMIDARGHGDSGGEAMDFGWYGDQDVRAGVDHLMASAGIDPARIGVLGLSMGGEEAIGVAGDDGRVAAVVAEGATARVAADKAWLSDEYGVRGAVQEQIERAQYSLTDLLSDASSPPSLRSSVTDAEGTPFLLITAGDVPDEASSARYIAQGAPDRVAIWTVDGAGHTDGLATDPEAWVTNVTGFFTRHLLGT